MCESTGLDPPCRIGHVRVLLRQVLPKLRVLERGCVEHPGRPVGVHQTHLWNTHFRLSLALAVAGSDWEECLCLQYLAEWMSLQRHANGAGITWRWPGANPRRHSLSDRLPPGPISGS